MRIISVFEDNSMKKLVSIELKSHEQYLDILNRVKKKTVYVEIVQPGGLNKDKKYIENDKVVHFANIHLRLVKECEVNEWLGTWSKPKGKKFVYAIYYNDETFWDFLSEFSSFFFVEVGKKGEWKVINTDFGLDDIAFLDKDKKPLFYTTTHEGYADIAKSLLKKSYVEK